MLPQLRPAGQGCQLRRAGWYARAATHGCSRSVLVHQIESDLHSRQGKALTNFDRDVLPPQSDLAQEVTKDPSNPSYLEYGEVRAVASS